MKFVRSWKKVFLLEVVVGAHKSFNPSTGLCVFQTGNRMKCRPFGERGDEMCWMCGSVRPYDGAYPKKDNKWKSGYITEDGTIAVPNEMADWEDLSDWPEWDRSDSNGTPFFLIAEPGG